MSSSLDESKNFATTKSKDSATNEKKAMRSLDILSENEGIDQQAQDDYAKLFRHPLSDSHLRALSALFKWSLPEDFGHGVESEMLG